MLCFCIAQHAHAQISDHPPPLAFPRSVSPYVSRRKSDASSATWTHPPPHDHRHHHRLRFYSTPQVGPMYYDSSASVADPDPYPNKAKKKKSRFSLITNLFCSRSDKFEIHGHHVPPSWFSTIFTGNGTRSSDYCSSAATTTGGFRTRRPPTDRGMSPDFDYACDELDGDRSPSGSGDTTETSPSWKRTPAVPPPSARRSKPGMSRNVGGLAFCLSPLVRASPNRHWTSQKGMPPEIGNSGEAARLPTKPHLSNAASFCKNRSRKLVDFGRSTQNR